MIVARTSSLIQPSAKPTAGLMTRVARAVTPTGQHEGRASNNRRETARSVPAMISKAPTAPAGIIANTAAASSASPTARMSSAEPKRIGAWPVLAPKRYWACNPPAPWDIGIAPNGLSSTFARPEEIARLRSLGDDQRSDHCGKHLANSSEGLLPKHCREGSQYPGHLAHLPLGGLAPRQLRPAAKSSRTRLCRFAVPAAM